MKFDEKGKPMVISNKSGIYIMNNIYMIVPVKYFKKKFKKNPLL